MDAKTTHQARHPLWGLMVTQFTGAFNDNVFKLVVALLAIRAATAALVDGDPDQITQAQTTYAFVIFTIPFILFSLPSGALADRVSKRTLVVITKAMELVLMTTAIIILAIDASAVTGLLIVLAFMGLQSAIFSPAKYGILPELVPREKLSSGNGLLTMWTNLAIIAGTAGGGYLLAKSGDHVWLIGLLLAGFSAAGLITAMTITKVPPAGGTGGIKHTVTQAWSAMRGDRVLGLAVAGAVVYWGMVSLLGQDVLVYTKTLTRHLPESDTLTSIPLVFFGLGIGIGSVLAGRLSAQRIEYGLLPLGAVCFSFVAFLMGVFAPGVYGTWVLMVFLGISSGLIIVPVNALIQARAPADRRGAVIALQNVFVWIGILSGSVIAMLFATVGLSSRAILLAAAFMTLGGTLWVVRLLPEALLRLILILLTNTFYRLKIIGREHIPATGGALLVPNHVSFVDGLFLMASTDRPIRFIVESTYFNRPWFKPLMKSMHAIPISAVGGPRVVLRALRDAGRYLDQGHLVCIFAEGQMTRSGILLPFRRGLERIAKGRTAPIVPVHLDRVWGSVFSREGGRFLSKLPKRIPFPVTVSFGEPLPSDTPIHEVRGAVQLLQQNAWVLRKAEAQPLHRLFVSSVRRHPFRMLFAEQHNPGLSNLKALIGSVALARVLRPHWQDQNNVGILLPPCIGAALANLAAAISGRTSVNLNYTTGPDMLKSAAQQAHLETVISNREFIEKAGVELPAGVTPIWIEDLAGTITRAAKVQATLLAIFTPQRWLEKACGASKPGAVDDVLTIIFSSGSTGDPKGVELTHFNVGSNLEAVDQALCTTHEDRLLGILPFFHSFGCTTFWMSCVKGLGIAFHVTPLDGAVIGELVQRHSLTLLVTTPTFLQLYLRRCTPAQFGSLRLIITGAEKLPEKLARTFVDQFGILPMEGYGATECAPVVATCVPDFRAPGFYQPGSRVGSVGQPIPGVALRIVDPETMEPRPFGEPGMLLVKGPNVMRGYLGRPDLTAKVIQDGWYITGDIARLDEDGFLYITDRLSRFSKIGGEMVPHCRLEEALHEAAGISDTMAFAVTAISHEQKGEQLSVLHTIDEQQLPEILQRLSQDGLPKIFIPRRDHFVKVDQLPILGTGKLDLRAIKQIAAQALGQT